MAAPHNTAHPGHDDDPIAVLRHEHRIVSMVIDAMDREARRIRANGRADPAAIEQIIDFARNFTDGCHHAKEERLLFTRLLQRDAAYETPIRGMVQEHESGREHITAIAQALPDAQTGDVVALREVADRLTAYAQLLRIHITKEDNVLFPLANTVLSADDRAWLTQEFDRVEREEVGDGAHERFDALARELARRAA